MGRNTGASGGHDRASARKYERGGRVEAYTFGEADSDWPFKSRRKGGKSMARKKAKKGRCLKWSKKGPGGHRKCLKRAKR